MSLGGKLTKMAGLPEITPDLIGGGFELGRRGVEALERMAAALEEANALTEVIARWSISNDSGDSMSAFREAFLKEFGRG